MYGYAVDSRPGNFPSSKSLSSQHPQRSPLSLDLEKSFWKKKSSYCANVFQIGILQVISCYIKIVYVLFSGRFWRSSDVET